MQSIFNTGLALLCFILASHSLAEGDSHSPDGETLSSGQLNQAFSSWGKASIQGDWSIVSTDTGLYIQLADNFVARQGPDVKVFLSPKPATRISGKNATEESLFVTLLDQFEGSLRIALPDGVDLSNYQSLVFHCEEYAKLWGTAALH